jgi:two-component system response regulator AdeR
VASQFDVLIVEDDGVVAETLTLYLQRAGLSVRTTRDGREGLAIASTGGPRLVILDLMIPGMNGHEVCRRLRGISAIPVLMLTARAVEDDRVRGLELGADDYVVKPFSAREVVARVQAILRRVASSADARPAPSRVGEIEIDPWSRQVRRRGQTIALTPTEFRLLEALARQPGRTFTRDELVARAFGPDYDGLDRTIDTHVTNLRRKLEAGSTPRCIVTVHGIGYRLVAPDAH